MVQVAGLSEQDRMSVADQVGWMVPQEAGLVDGGDLELAESLPVRSLRSDRLHGLDGPLRDVTDDLAEWRHQILRGERTAFTAASVAGEDGQEVVELAETGFAEALSHAIRSLDERLGDDDDLAELLIVPSYFLVAILISGREERVLVVERPERLSSIEVGYIYPSAQFVEALRRYPPATGVPPRPVG